MNLLKKASIGFAAVSSVVNWASWTLFWLIQLHI